MCAKIGALCAISSRKLPSRNLARHLPERPSFMIELAELINGIREELNKARLAGGGEELRFEVGPIELEIEVTAARNGKSGIKVYVLELGANVSKQTTQRVKLALQPRDHNTGREPQISGAHDHDNL
jgi:hypothetical protein